MGFYHVDQAGIELLTSDDPPTSASQSAGIIGVSHCTQPDPHIKDSSPDSLFMAKPRSASTGEI
ncbi:hypothetical protein AAY473_028863 [Plecturocebus cupreus]